MRRLYLQIYLTFVGVIALFCLLLAAVWLLTPPTEDDRRMFEGAGEVAARMLPAPDRPLEELRETLRFLADRLQSDLAVFDADGSLLAAVGEPLPAPSPERREGGAFHRPGARGAFAIRLPDGRWLVARHVHSLRGIGGLGILALLAAAIGAGAYPLVRRTTRRLERLQERVDRLGAGDLSARVDVEGSDEVAELARSFNRAADRIERLVEAQRSMLASASHELRTPLTRMRMAIELLAGDDRPELRERVAEDIAELDELIGELLLASRLAASDVLEGTERVDLLALVAEEGARSGAAVSGQPAQVEGDRRMLRHLVRNLLENARRHGRDPLEATVAPREGGGARLRVLDRGEGVPASERERIFEPFYRPAGSAGQGGVGLGLALVRQIARRHGGDARCLARAGGGTCFEVELAGA
jgi:signal transduction histidine kinase